MKFTTATVAAAAAAFVSAEEKGSKITDGDVFKVVPQRTGSDLHFGKFQAFQSGLYINLPSQNASCGTDLDYAQLKLNTNSLFLNTKAPVQQFFVDRSGMGQGVIQYTTGVQPATKNSERVGWTVNEDNNLVFRDPTSNKDLGFIACPGSETGSFSVWLDVGIANPAGNEDCIGFTASAAKEPESVDCSYTS